MHRLREWFGIKDWQGPPKTSLLDDKKDEPKPDLSAGSTTTDSTPVSVAKQAVNSHDNSRLKPAETVQQNPTILDKTGLWLKQYIPHKQGTCYSCKLVAMTTALAYSVLMTSLTLTQYKKFTKEYRNVVLLCGFSASTVALSYTILMFNDEDPFAILKEKTDKMIKKQPEK